MSDIGETSDVVIRYRISEVFRGHLVNFGRHDRQQICILDVLNNVILKFLLR